MLLHGSRTPGLTALEPRAPIDGSVDEFSKRHAVFATEDPTWAIAYGVRAASCRGFLNACFYPDGASTDWSRRRIYLSYAADDNGRAPLTHGVVYALPRVAFTRMPPHVDPVLGPITECQWISETAVPVIAEVAVLPANLPMVPQLHDHAMVTDRSSRDPAGFPWLT